VQLGVIGAEERRGGCVGRRVADEPHYLDVAPTSPSSKKQDGPRKSHGGDAKRACESCWGRAELHDTRGSM
jgi:hypothetical protein